MALISCPECGHMVSDRAAACPSCGYPIASVVSNAFGKPYEQEESEPQCLEVSENVLNESEGGSLLERFAASGQAALMRGVAKNPMAEESVLLHLSSCDDKEVRSAVARHPNATEAILQALARDKDEDVRGAVTNNANASLDLLLAMTLDPCGAVRWGAAKNPNCAPALETVVGRGDEMVTRGALLNHCAPESILRRFISNQELCLAVAGNRNTPSEVLRSLAKESNWSIRETLMRNPSSPPDVLTYLFRNHCDVDLERALARNPHAPSDLLAEMSCSSMYATRSAVASNRGIDFFVLRQLACDSHMSVRQSAASNPRMTEDLLHHLATDKEYLVREAVAKNENTSIEDLSLLSQDPNVWVRVAAAKNPSAINLMLHDMIQRGDSEIWIVVAAHPNISLSDLSYLFSHDTSDEMRFAVASNPASAKAGCAIKGFAI